MELSKYPSMENTRIFHIEGRFGEPPLPPPLGGIAPGWGGDKRTDTAGICQFRGNAVPGALYTESVRAIRMPAGMKRIPARAIRIKK